MALFSFARPTKRAQMTRQLHIDALGSVIVIGLIAGIVVFFARRSEIATERLTATTRARMIELQPNYHNTIKYEYFVFGVRYEGDRQGGSDFAVGSWYPVYYDPANPSFSSIGNKPPIDFRNNVVTAAGGLALFCICFIVAYYSKLRQNQRLR
jgi:hypothetical protein